MQLTHHEYLHDYNLSKRILQSASRDTTFLDLIKKLTVTSHTSIMKGLMQDWPLVVTNIIDHAAKFHGEQLVVTCTVEGPVHQYTYADMRRRSQLCALAMRQLSVGCASRDP